MKRNAIILAAGTSSRFVPLSYEYPKGLLKIKGEILIERQISQLKEAGIDDITVVVGYKAGMFSYLKEKYGVCIVFNEDYSRYNNTSSLIRVLDRLGDTYICSSDNYFSENVFKGNPERSYYSALYSEDVTGEYCIRTNSNEEIDAVSVGGSKSWYMVGHAYFDRKFSESFSKLLKEEYRYPETRNGYWEDVFIRHIGDLPPLLINHYRQGQIEEFDSLDELRLFDQSYYNDTRSRTIKFIAEQLGCPESELYGFAPLSKDCGADSFTFYRNDEHYQFNCADNTILTL